MKHLKGDRLYAIELYETILKPAAVVLPGFRTLGSTAPIEKLTGGHEGEKRDTIFYTQSTQRFRRSQS